MLHVVEGRKPLEEKIRYAVVGLGHIVQAAVLPAFAHAKRNSQLVALVSGDAKKLRALSEKYGVPYTYSYRQFEQCLEAGHIDVVYIALPNHLHCDFTVRAAKAGRHVLCEKPLALSEQECRAMIAATARHRVKLMTAYRLHFDPATLQAIEEVSSGAIGEPRIFQSVFTMQVAAGNIRVKKKLGGGTLWDIGIYCINAARYLFKDEPIEVSAFAATNRTKRFREVEEMASVMLRFPEDRLAMFTCSFGATDVSAYQVVGTTGELRMEWGYDYAMPMVRRKTVNGNTSTKTFPARDQFAPQLMYFSDCILEDKQPEPNGMEGLLDVRIIQAAYRSARSGRPVRLPRTEKPQRPTSRQLFSCPPVKKPNEILTAGPRR